MLNIKFAPPKLTKHEYDDDKYKRGPYSRDEIKNIFSAQQYLKATEIASQAIELFSNEGASSKVEEVQQRRKLYLSNQPYRQ